MKTSNYKKLRDKMSKKAIKESFNKTKKMLADIESEAINHTSLLFDKTKDKIKKLLKDIDINRPGKLEITFTYNDCGGSEILELDNFMYKDFDILCDIAESLEKKENEKIDKLKDLISKAAPLAWATGNYDNDAHQWEKEAEKLLKEI